MEQLTAQYQVTTAQSIQVVTALVELPGTDNGQRLERVVSNLLANASRYSPRGGPITQMLATETDRADAWAVLTARDVKLGILPRSGVDLRPLSAGRQRRRDRGHRPRPRQGAP